jgi:hypothetical protein
MVFIVLGSVALTCTTPWPGQFARYLMPIAPFLTIAAVLASEQFEAALRRSVWATALARTTFAALLLLAFTVQVYAALSAFCLRGPAFAPKGGGRGDFRFFYHDRSWRAWEEAVAWIDAHAAPDAIVATNALHFCYLRTGRRVVLPPMEADPARARRLLEAVPVSYVIIDQLEFQDVSRRYARPAVENDPVGWHLVYSVNGIQIYQRATGAK